MKKSTKYLIGSLSIVCFGALAIWNLKDHSNEIIDNDTASIVISADYPVTSELDDMISEADMVVVGKYLNFDSKWNMARDPEDITKEDPENFVEGRLYQFKVDQVVKGADSSEIIKVNHRVSETLKVEESDAVIAANGTVKKSATWESSHEVVNQDPLYIAPNIGSKYMVFLKYDEMQNNYYGAIEPFSIKFNDEDIAELQSNIKNTSDHHFSSKKNINGKTIEITNHVESTIDDKISGLSFENLKQYVEDNH